MSAPRKFCKIFYDVISKGCVGDEALWKIDGPKHPHIEFYGRDVRDAI